MTTKDKILNCALQLYNEQGPNKITSRHIATELGMSPGNLHYHFKHTDDIIIQLFNQLADSFDELISELEQSKVDLNYLMNFTNKSFDLVYTYRFIFLSFVELGRRIPAIQQFYQEINERRLHEFKTIFKNFQKKKIFRQDIPSHVLDLLVNQIFIVGDFWPSNNDLTLKLEQVAAKKYYSKIFLNMFYPYFEPSIQVQYQSQLGFSE
ncbi:TetR/AcrR family transcriptional regulator [Neptunitalea lumnitzerae]|uniref:HTH tetR-type domain-containing protein n=1 Tax=Neptunitalea lumnitzerae TaxID=2965509 RepID=A0ABQ5MJB4_9FLAO|nr:TetR/AcrR family transcriptional regulator [Neptunitalea sp. Y10]GLB49417.1 hypothetical protein Y10_17850 [Neptunitalea sp. Y10]